MEGQRSKGSAASTIKKYEPVLGADIAGRILVVVMRCLSPARPEKISTVSCAILIPQT